MDKSYFSKKNAIPGFNSGITFNLERNKWLIEYSANVYGSKVTLKCAPFSTRKINYSELSYKMLVFSNQLSIGFQIIRRDKPNWKLFVCPSLQYNIASISKIWGKGIWDPSIIKSYEETFPSIMHNQRYFGVGIGGKIRTEIKKFGKIDYGISYIYLATTFPELSMKAETYNKTYSAILQPRIHLLNIHFIYFFKRLHS